MIDKNLILLEFSTRSSGALNLYAEGEFLAEDVTQGGFLPQNMTGRIYLLKTLLGSGFLVGGCTGGRFLAEDITRMWISSGWGHPGWISSRRCH